LKHRTWVGGAILLIAGTGLCLHAFQDLTSNESNAISHLRSINTAEVQYLVKSGSGYADLSALIRAELLEPRFASTLDGYNFAAATRGTEYLASAVPAAPESGRYGFFVEGDGVIHYSATPSLAPPGQTEKPVRVATTCISIAPNIAKVGDFIGPVNECAAVANLRTINVAELTYLSISGGTYGNLDALIHEALVDARFKDVMNGYRFSITTEGSGYKATAVPATPEMGRFAYFIGEDGAVRYSSSPGMAPAGKAGRPVR